MIALVGYDNFIPLSKGTFITLYRAVRSYDNLPVLIKYPNSPLPSPRILSGLQNEFATSQELGSSGIIRAVTLQRTDNSLALILEDRNYELLKDIIEENGTGIADKLHIAINIIKSLNRIHDNGFLHRGIRPESIAVAGRTGDAVLTDLQYSCRISGSIPIPNSGLIPDDNLPYISPEQSGRINTDLDRRSDFYSLGVTLFELFSGQPPFKTGDALELIHCHLAKEPPVPERINPDIPTALSEVILKLLAKNPGDRYQSGHGIIQDLKICLKIIQKQDSGDGFKAGNQDISDTFTLSKRLFGRKKEKEKLLAAYSRTSLGSCEVVVVRGEPGSGKSALVHSISKYILKEQGEFISGKFDQFQRNRPYSAIIQAVQEMLRQRLESPAPVIEAWKKRICDALGENTGLITDVIPELEQLVGPQQSPQNLPSAESRNRFNLTFKNFIKAFPNLNKPLVLFLDDMQWADSSTVQLIKRLLEDQDASHLMIIGAYRTEQPLEKTIQSILTEIEELDSRVETITLDRMSPRHVQGFISRTLRADRKRTESLAGIVFKRTGGNPLFVREYLRNLYRSGLITFSHSKNRWEWDLKAITDMTMDGNIVDLMVDKIKAQPPEGQEILKAASCIGGRFDLRILVAVQHMPEDVTIDYLNMAIKEGLIVPDDDILTTMDHPDDSPPYPRYLSFMHDRVQQAAYSMLSTEERKRLHLSIGRAMLDKYSESEIRELVFEIATQYDLCLSELTAGEERERIAEILTIAGRKAKRSSAFEVAARYFASAVKMFGDDCWKNNRQRTFNLHLDWYESSFLSGAAKHSEEIFKSILNNTETRNDLSRANIIKMQLYFDQSRYHESTKIGLEMLEQYGIKVPRKPDNFSLWLELLKTRLALAGKNTDNLLNLPEMTDPDRQQALRLLMYSIAPAYMFNKKLVFFMIMKMIRFSLKYGNAPASAFGYMFYAMFLATRNSDLKNSCKFVELSAELNERFRNSELETKINMLRGAMHDHWHTSLAQNIVTLETAYQKGLLHGDNSYARYCAYFTVYYVFLQGISIADVYSAEKKFSAFIRKNQNSLGRHHLAMTVQMCRSLEGKTYTPGYLDDDNFQEMHLINMARSSGSEVLEHWARLSKIIILSFFRHHAKALEYIEKIFDRVESTLSGMYLVPVFLFFSIINMAAVYEEASPQVQKKYMKRMRQSLARLEQWQHNCPENFKHLYVIAKAEINRLQSRLSEAIFLYEEGIRSCSKINSNGFAGLACELASNFHFSIGGKESGLSLLSAACSYYEKWGASAKVQKLMHNQRMLQNDLAPAFGTPEGNNRHEMGKNSHNLDISAVVRASQAISGEIVLDRLLDKLMRIVIENAGAQKATLLLHNKNTLELTAHAFVSSHGITTRVNPGQDNGLYCKSIVNYVLRSKDNIVLRDAGAQGPFTIDSYIIRTKPKSILAMPVINQQIMRGVLYLENNLSPGVFTEDRLEVLNLLCSQAAISIQNARLYSDLRDSETQHRTLLESINVGAFRGEANREVKLISGNRALAEMFGFHSWAEFKATPLRSLFIDPRTHESILGELIDGRTVRDREVNMRRRDGTPIWVSMTASLQHDGSERKSCIDGVLEDITEKRKARELEKAKVAADAANKAKSDFLASMSHEIRTPMNAILGMADMLWESRLNKTQRNYVKLFKNAGENLLLLINDILDLSKIEAGQINLEEIDFNLEELFSEIASIFALRAQLKQIEFCWYISPEVPRIITGDPTRLRQVLVNLVGNSMKFTEKGLITFEASLTDTGLLRMLIKDSGVGIPEDKMNSIFDTFSQADSSTTRNFGGTGLGLSICTRMVKSMHGGIFVSSEHGKGSTFAFTILPGIPVQPEILPPLKGTSILITDRDCVCRNFLYRSLRDLGGDIHHAETLGESAAAAAAINLTSSENRILIVGTPSGDCGCFETLKKLKHGPCRDWKLMMIMDAKPEAQDTVRSKQLGACYVHRPVNPLAVVEEIKYGNAYCMLEDKNEDEISDEPINMNCTIPFPLKAETQARTTDSRSNSILLVEDSEDNRIVIDLFLKKTPYRITYAENGQDGLEKYMTGEFDLVLMDIQMPIMDGYEATRAIRKYEQENQLPETPIMALTANAFREDEEKCLECGCNGHMAKPIKKKKLLKVLEELLMP